MNFLYGRFFYFVVIMICFVVLAVADGEYVFVMFLFKVV